jgi:hypothetical protein
MTTEDPRSLEAAQCYFAAKQPRFVKPEDRELVNIGGVVATRVSDHEVRAGSEGWCRYPGGFAEYLVATLEESDGTPEGDRKARPIGREEG